MDMTPTTKFIQSLGQTPGLATQLQQNLQRLKDNLDEIIKVLSYTKTVADDLGRLQTALQTTSDLLTIVSVIPEVGGAAAPLKQAVTALLKEVKPAKRAADKLEAKVKPFREYLAKLDPVLEKMIKACGTITSTSQGFLNTFTPVVNCVDSLPEGAYKTDAQNYLNKFSSSVQPYVDDLNQALQVANDAINTFYKALQNLKKALNPLKAIAAAAKKVLKVLDPVLHLLNKVNHALKSIKITIPVPYPMKISLYDVFRRFKKFIKLAMAPIQGLVNRLLKALKIRLPSIPGLSDLIHLSINLPGIPGFSALLDPILAALRQLEQWIPKFSLTCPPGPGATVPKL